MSFNGSYQVSAFPDVDVPSRAPSYHTFAHFCHCVCFLCLCSSIQASVLLENRARFSLFPEIQMLVATACNRVCIEVSNIRARLPNRIRGEDTLCGIPVVDCTAVIRVQIGRAQV